MSLTNVLRDQDCPKCQYPETYTSVDFDLPAEVNPRAIGCRRCGWTYSPLTQLLNPYTFDPIDFPDTPYLNPVSTAYLLTAPELADTENPGSWEDAVARRWQEFREYIDGIRRDSFDEGAERAWELSTPTQNGKTYSITVDGETEDWDEISFGEAYPDENPYQ